MTYALIIIGVWIVYILLNIGIAELNDHTRRSRIAAKDPRQINHPLWAFYYSLLCVPAYLFFKDWYLIGSLLLLHISIFPVAYNRLAGNPAFNLSKTTTAMSDRFMVWIGLKSTEAVNIMAMVGSIVLLILAIKSPR